MYGPKAHAKCRVTGEGVDAAFVSQSEEAVATVLKKYGLRRDFFLYIGSGKKHKNVSMLLEAFSALAGDQRQLALVMPGKPPSCTLPEHVLLLPSVEEKDLPALYSAAGCFVTASLYEGYGLPVAEALYCGCPVIATHRTAIPETAAGAAVLVEPSAQALTDAMRNPPKRPVTYNRPQWSHAAISTVQTLQEALR
jgi:glycosyltransferase involved in cell wall biosynthesis